MHCPSDNDILHYYTGLLSPDVGEPTRAVDVGSSLLIMCQADIPPPLRPTIGWFNSDGDNITSDITLSFTDIRKEDEGMYECRVMTKNGGILSSSVNIIVNIIGKSVKYHYYTLK